MSNIEEDITINELNELPKYKICPNEPRSCNKIGFNRNEKYCSNCGSKLVEKEPELMITLETRRTFFKTKQLKVQISLDELIYLIKNKLGEQIE